MIYQDYYIIQLESGRIKGNAKHLLKTDKTGDVCYKTFKLIRSLYRKVDCAKGWSYFMSDVKQNGNFLRSGEVSAVVEKIAEICSPQFIYLYNQRIDSRNELSSFKLCIVAGIEDKLACERDIYMKADCDIPFDILMYTPEEWEQLVIKSGSFASRINETGVVLYNG